MKGKEEKQRSRLGYGSSYRKGINKDLKSNTEIGSVMGGQVWMVKPDKKAGTSNPCIWMKAGVVEFKDCNNFYDCTGCKYDKGMVKRVDDGKQLSWQDAMRRRPSLDRVCRHSLTNRISKRSCAYDYECSKCDFDQFFEEIWSFRSSGKPRDVNIVKGFEVPLGHYFHQGHTWVKIESGGYVRVGIDDFAMKLLGKADSLDLPSMGKVLDHDQAGWGLKREGNLADVLSPVDGVIMEVNPSVRQNPGLANMEPYGVGWLFMVRTPDIKKELKKLMIDSESIEWMNNEVHMLDSMIEDVAGPLAADGGYLSNDIFGALPELGWENLTKKFLRS